MMNKNQAYELALEKVNELIESGIEVKIEPSKSMDDQKTLDKFNMPENISPDKWVHVTFEISDPMQAIKINEAANYLGLCGMTFDLGGTKTTRDWELDWSFLYIGEEATEWKDAVNECERNIEQFSQNQFLSNP